MDHGEEDLLAFARALPAACWLKDAGGRYRFVNERTRDLGLVTGSIIGLEAHQVFSPELASDLIEGDRRVLATGEPVWMPTWVPRSDGSRCHLAIVKFPVETSQGKLIGGLALDVTSLSAATWGASTFRQILDAISDMIVVKGPKSRIEWANKAFLEAYGTTNRDIHGVVEGPFTKPELAAQYLQDDQRVFSTGRSLDIPKELMARPDGTLRACHTVKSPIFDRDGAVIMTVGVSRDVTDANRLEVELRQAQKLESIGRLAAGMAHEINTPMQFVGDSARFARDAINDLLELCTHYQAVIAKVARGTATPADAEVIAQAEENADLAFIRERAPAAIDSIIEGVRRVSQLVRGMKEFGHPDRGSMQLADIDRALQTTLLVARHETKYVADIALDLGGLTAVECNINELDQVFLNLIVNAAHAIGDSGRRGRICITTRREGEHALISVADDGTGIPESARARIFDPFFTTKAVGRGTGQGLSIARMIVVDKHRGSLTYETELGQGTAFHVRIPVRQVTRAA